MKCLNSSFVKSFLFVSFIAFVAFFVEEEVLPSLYEYEHCLDYDIHDIDMPRVAGWQLKVMATVIRLPIVGSLLVRLLMKQNEMNRVRRFAFTLPNPPLYYPLVFLSDAENKLHETYATNFSLPFLYASSPYTREEQSSSKANPTSSSTSSFRYYTSQDYVAKYKSGELTPLQVARAVLHILDSDNQGNRQQDAKAIPSLNAFISWNKSTLLAFAKESTDRYAAQRPLGPLDGVPIGIKDEFPVKGYPTTYGTQFMQNVTGIATEDNILVRRLRQAGAMIVGKTNMEEMGLGASGQNIHHGMIRNPHNVKHYAGGSSSGSGAAVAAGIVPLALGNDGGGSIRIPAGLCGVYGIKGTFYRVMKENNDCATLGHPGPIASSIYDTALAYAIVSGTKTPEEKLLNKVHHHMYFEDGNLPLDVPPAHFHGFTQKDLSGMKIGVFSEYFNHSSPIVRDSCYEALDKFVQRGATLIPIEIPHLEDLRIAHLMTILTELSEEVDKYYEKYSAQYSYTTQIGLEIAKRMSARDFVAAQRIRHYMLHYLLHHVFNEVDVFVTPTTASTAPFIREDALETGENDMGTTSQLFRYTFLANALGIPGITLPVGYDEKQLPISLQFQTKHWNEHLLFQLGNVWEDVDVLQKPAIYYDVLELAKMQSKASGTGM